MVLARQVKNCLIAALLAAVALLAVALWPGWQPGPPANPATAPPPAATENSTPATPPAASGRPRPTGDACRLFGSVLADEVHASRALLACGGARAAWYSAGDTILPGVRLVEVGQRNVLLDDQGTPLTLWLQAVPDGIEYADQDGAEEQPLLSLEDDAEEADDEGPSLPLQFEDDADETDDGTTSLPLVFED